MSINPNNGLLSFTIHGGDDNERAIREVNDSFRTASKNMVSGTKMKAQDIARSLMDRAMASQAQSLKGFNRPMAKDSKLDFKPIQVEEIPFTGNKLVKFRQTINGISVYGSVINVEVDKETNLASLNSSIAPEIDVDTVAKISPGNAIKIAEHYISANIPASVTPMLYIYFIENGWRLVYVISNVISERREQNENQEQGEKIGHAHANLKYVSVIIDAQDGRVLKLSPRSMSLKAAAKGDDGLDYDITFRDNGEFVELVDEQYNVFTYDLNFGEYNSPGNLPGTIITKNSNQWMAAGVNAHYNACRVAKFLHDKLRRNGIDNKGITLISTVRCVERNGDNDWNNAAWLPTLKQMVYGQTHDGVDLRSLAVALDVVAHEIFHGVTESTSDLNYEMQSGALNESYSDIFGFLISNENIPRANWNWELGEAVGGVPFRDLANPTKYGQPDHMNDYQHLPNSYFGDWGGVHLNSGIHNKAAYNLAVSVGPTDQYVFNDQELAVLFYLGLIQLSNTSGFTDSCRSILNAASSVYKNDPGRKSKLDVIKTAFAAVGIQS
jgi:Zn-dependent metalloprotease